MSHKQVESHISSREGYQLYAPQGSIAVSKPSYIRRAIGGSLLVLGISLSFFTGRFYFPYNSISSNCQPNIDCESFTPSFMLQNNKIRALLT